MPLSFPPFTLRLALGFAALASLLLFLRSPATNFVFDEQEALLANPYVLGNGGFWSAFTVDFWGRPVAETIGSYRPLPNLIWRSLAFTLRSNTPFYLELVNVLLHGVVAAWLGFWVKRTIKSDVAAWMTMVTFVSFALSTEAVCSIVGLSDVLAGLCTVALLQAGSRGPWLGPLLAFAAAVLALFAKETALSVLVPATIWATRAGPGSRPWRALGFGSAVCLSVVCYVSVRGHFFPVREALTKSAFTGLPLLGPLAEHALDWFRQPLLTIDPINNPLAGLGFTARLPTVAQVYAEGLGQGVLPIGLSADYSVARTVVESWSVWSALGLVLFGLGVLAGAVVWLRAEPGSRSALFGWSLAWVPLTALWTSNALVLLPTVRADRLWYLPALGLACSFGCLFSWLLESTWHRWAAPLCGTTLLAQATAARLHALDYNDDLTFWAATAKAAPASAKAQLNWGVMLGARGDAAGRVERTQRATRLAPDWPMGHVYLADAECRRGDLDAAWPSYRRGFELGANNRALVALGLQCLWDKGAFAAHRDDLVEMSKKRPGTWLAYLVHEVDVRGTENHGVPGRYRPRAYNQKSGG